MFDPGPGREGEHAGGSRIVHVDVRGVPRPQGSMKVVPRKHGPGFATKYPAPVWAWRSQVQQAVAELELEPFVGPVVLRLGFDLPRPLGHFGTGRNAGLVRRSAPGWPAVMPDLDKLARCIGDAITDAGLWHDDAQVIAIHAAKRYAEPPGVFITVSSVMDEP